MIFLLIVCGVFSTQPATSGSNGLKFVETADGSKSRNIRELVQWTHSRMVFSKPLERVAVGQKETLQVEILGSNELLALAKKVGRTSIMVWYTDETSETFLFSVIEDLSVLHSALGDIHPGIRLTLAPDRAALVLRGRVPTIEFRNAAESAARHYLDAGRDYQPSATDVLLQSTSGQQGRVDARFRLPGSNDQKPRRNVAKAAIINLIQVEELPLDITEKVKNAVDRLGGAAVTVTRIQQGDTPRDEVDTLLLGGFVETQVDLVRVLNLASRLFTGNYTELSGVDTITTIANESGGLVNGARTGTAARSSGFGSNPAGTFGSGLAGNNLLSNVGRAKMLSVAGGRILSTIEVRDLPQVRVAVQMYEVNRRQLKQWRPDFSLISNGYDSGGGNFGLAGASSQAASASQVENALQVLGGTLVNNFQLGSRDIAFDLLFSLLEEEGISRTLSRPNLTVLAGESAVFRAGGEVPVPTAFAPTGIANDDQIGTNTAGVFSGTEFKAFGVQLAVRALVDEKDRITLDLNPVISMPDTLLTQDIAGSTGAALNTSAFNVRSLNTSTRLRDGQPLIIGGLVSRDISDSHDFVPGVSQLPLLGSLAEATSAADSERELIIIVTPTIVREPRHEVELWQFPLGSEILRRVLNSAG
ncbi:pilus assembly protein N-terminal domain-containing protein [Pseudomaricurvus alcaniphilus]|uniref:pilus assembly protein N-terminal domain-containing protein n=1 Tax=Pseudomaricurvus alcaniphilus TaxID=1166482 RepID=UPI001A9E02EF|nr:pilus assembly protein N-terminal domain-containing protein [Pseudomaricurvus alcaniphilus]